MRTSKKILALLLALIMVAALGATAFAADPTYTITLKNAEPGTYRAYRIFTIEDTGDANNDGVYDAASYPKVHDAWVPFFTAPDGAGKDYLVDAQLPDTDPNYPLHEVKLGTETKYINITESNKETFAALARVYALTLTNGFNEKVQSATGDLSFTVTGPGYFVVFETKDHNSVKPGYTTMVTLTNAKPNAEAISKSIPRRGEKGPAKGYHMSSHIEFEGTATGVAVYYEIRNIFFPDVTGLQEKHIEIMDKWTPGALKNVTAAVWWVDPANTIGYHTLPADYYTLTYDTDNFVLDIDCVALAAGSPNLVGKELYVEVRGYPTIQGSKEDFIKNFLLERTPDGWQEIDDVVTWSNRILVTKIDAKTGEPVAGAKFVLVKKESGNVYRFTGNPTSIGVWASVHHYTKGLDPDYVWEVEDGTNGVLFAALPRDVSELAGAEDLVSGYTMGAHVQVFAKLDELEKVNGTFERFVHFGGDNEKWYFKFPSGNGLASDRYTIFETDANGKIEINGLPDGNYVLREVEAPAGYHLLKEDIEVPLFHSDSNGTPVHAVAEPIVPNPPSTWLPETGGVGTTIFYILGSCMLLGAAVLLITRKRMKGES